MKEENQVKNLEVFVSLGFFNDNDLVIYNSAKDIVEKATKIPVNWNEMKDHQPQDVSLPEKIKLITEKVTEDLVHSKCDFILRHESPKDLGGIYESLLAYKEKIPTIILVNKETAETFNYAFVLGRVEGSDLLVVCNAKPFIDNTTYEVKRMVNEIDIHSENLAGTLFIKDYVNAVEMSAILGLPYLQPHFTDKTYFLNYVASHKIKGTPIPVLLSHLESGSNKPNPVMIGMFDANTDKSKSE